MIYNVSCVLKSCVYINHLLIKEAIGFMAYRWAANYVLQKCTIHVYTLCDTETCNNTSLTKNNKTIELQS